MIEILAVALVVVVLVATVAVTRSQRSRTALARAVSHPTTAAPETGAVAPVVLFLRRHRGARLALSGLSVVLVLAAVGMLAYPVYTNCLLYTSPSPRDS